MTDQPLKPGDKVRIISGPFRGGNALVRSIEQQNLQVEMLVLGQPTPFTVRLDQVKRCQHQAPDTDTAHEPAHHH